MYVAVKAFIFFIFRGLEITSDTSLRQIRQQVCWVSRLLDLIFTTEKQRVNNSQKKKDISRVCHELTFDCAFHSINHKSNGNEQGNDLLCWPKHITQLRPL